MFQVSYFVVPKWTFVYHALNGSNFEMYHYQFALNKRCLNYVGHLIIQANAWNGNVSFLSLKGNFSCGKTNKQIQRKRQIGPLRYISGTKLKPPPFPFTRHISFKLFGQLLSVYATNGQIQFTPQTPEKCWFCSPKNRLQFTHMAVEREEVKRSLLDFYDCFFYAFH